MPCAQNWLRPAVLANAARAMAVPIPRRRDCGCTTNSAIAPPAPRGGLRLR
ncbi:Uncharacterised protein [Mycobacterium tuberculosis]|nr:Uncharacterised protein [Mycobacterium tuberculosis]